MFNRKKKKLSKRKIEKILNQVQDDKMKKIKKHWKIIILLLMVLTTISFTLIFLNLQSKSSIAAAVPGVPTDDVLQPFGGPISATIDCVEPSSCSPSNPPFVLCIIVRCILQVPFILHVFDNYYQPPVDAFDKLREDTLEPAERDQCPTVCESFYPPGLTGVTPPGYTRCTWFCGGLINGLQQANGSPVGLLAKGLREGAKKAGVKSPGMVLIFNPVPGKTQSCKDEGYILGKGLGTGLYFTTPDHPVGDSCRGSYYTVGR